MLLSLCVCSFKPVIARDIETEFTWSTDFEQGNAKDVHLRDDGAVGFSIEKAPGGEEYLWFYFKIYSNSVEPLEFVLENAAGAHQTGKRWNITRPFFSSDGKQWQRASKTHYGKEKGLTHLLEDPVFKFKSPIAAETLHVAYFQPYTNEMLISFIEKIKSRDEVSISSLGLSKQGRDIHLLKIELPEKSDSTCKSIWIIGREHPGETPLSFVCEGMIEELLNDPAGQRLLANCHFNIVPILNVDGVALGHYYHNASGINLARDWVDFSAMETRILRDAISQDMQTNEIWLLINLHSSNDPTKGHFFLKVREDVLSPENVALQDNIFDAAKGKHPQMQAHSPVTLLDLPGITGNALSRDYGVYCLYLESNYSRGADGSEVTIQSLRETGEALVQTLAEVLTPE